MHCQKKNVLNACYLYFLNLTVFRFKNEFPFEILNANHGIGVVFGGVGLSMVRKVKRWQMGREKRKGKWGVNQENKTKRIKKNQPSDQNKIYLTLEKSFTIRENMFAFPTLDIVSKHGNSIHGLKLKVNFAIIQFG